MSRWLWTTWLAIPVLNTLQQLFLKLGASDAASSTMGSGWFGNLLASPWFAAAVAAEIVCFVIWMTVLAELDLSLAFPLSAASYVFVMVMAWGAFGEHLLTREIIGSLVILGGIWCLVTATTAAEK
ncbi:MAG: Permease of the drug/metabolite transporter superfamily [Proteobacteria bacterium]|nr:Permease of the drug/metabolite transporter superfamily [Pseudomonadota bacterium]